MSIILSSVLTLGVIALIAAVILSVCAKKFAVEEDPRLGQVAAILPQANCGGCGFPGCSGFAAACFKEVTEKGSIGALICPVGGGEVMDQVVAILSAGGGEAPAAASAPAKGGEAKKAAPKEIKPMSTDPKPFKEPTGLDWSGPKQNPIPAMPSNLRPAVLPKNWPAMSNK